MRYFLLLTLFTCLATIAISRPSRLDNRSDRETEENEYEGSEEAAAEDTVQENEESELSDQESSDSNAEEEARSQHPMRFGRERLLQRNMADDADRPVGGNADNFPEYTQEKGKAENFEDGAQINNNAPSNPKRRQPNRYMDNSDVNDPPKNFEHLTNLNNYKTNRQADTHNNDLDKRLIDSQISSIDDDAVFDNGRENRNNQEKIKYNNEVADSSEQSRHFKQYYNTMQSEHRSLLGDNNYESYRDRRQAEAGDSINLSSTSTEKDNIVSADISNEEDEAAIRRHIKKLSGEELEELLNSLSDDKKALLNRIIDNDRNSYETVNKREITKKAEAVEENSYMDVGLSENSKLQGGSPSMEFNTDSAVSQSTEIENTKQESQTESGDISTKAAETTRVETPENKGDMLKEPCDATANGKLHGSAYDTNDASSSAQSKIENKRETNSDNFKNPDSSFEDTQLSENYFNSKDGDDSFSDQDHFCLQEDDLSQLIDEEAQLHSNEHQYKREAQDSQADFDDSMKSLEESFPNSNAEENGQYFKSNMAPLVRVKRTDDNLIVKKRAAGVLPDAKVAYFPYKAENDDEDTDEGSEFDDEGFYDRTSNFAKNNVNKPAEKTASKYSICSLKSKLTKTNNKDEPKRLELANEQGDTMSLGSDTDSVLSGVEGVDDNLMFSSARNRRTLEGNADQDRPLPSTLTLDGAPKVLDSFNVPNYQESDAFGSLPRNYEGELSRYKRIRRVKPSLSPDALESHENE